MSTNPTTNRAYGKPTDQGSSDVWGVELNALFDAVDVDVHKLLNAAKFGTAGGTGDVLTLTCSPTYAAYVEGMILRVKIAADNTTGPTINVDSLGAKDIKARDGSTLAAGALKTGDIALIAYDGTRFLLLDAVKATTAETLLGTSAVKALTPAGLAGLNSTSGTTFIAKLPGGYMIQAGKYTSGSANPTVTFPTAFSAAPHVTLTAYGTGSDTNVSSLSVRQAALGTVSATNFTAYCSSESEISDVFVSATNVSFDWIAFGTVATS